MPSRQDIEDFLAQEHLAFVGVSRNTKEFANSVYRALQPGRTLYPVNQEAGGAAIEGDPSFSSLAEVPDPVDGVVVLVPRDEVGAVVDEALARGIRRVWLHRGAGMPPPPSEVVARCREAGVEVVDGACPLMFAGEVGGVHRLHRAFIRRRFTD